MFQKIGLVMIAMFATMFSPSDDAWAAASELALFSKRLSDGSTIVLECKKWAERTTKYFEAEDDEGRHYSDYKETIFRYRLVKVAGEKKEKVWETQIIIGFPSGIRPAFIVKDAGIFDGILYFLYAFQDGALNVTALIREDSGRWTRVMSARLDDRPRSLEDCRFFRDSGKLGITCFDPNTVAPHKEIWDIIDGLLKKRLQ